MNEAAQDFAFQPAVRPGMTGDAAHPLPGKARWIVCQLGARMHYAVPRILQEAGLLERFCTDICAEDSWPRLLKLIPDALQPAELKRLTDRTPEILSPERISSYPWFGLSYYLKRHFTTHHEALTEIHLWAGKAFGDKVVAQGFGSAKAVYAFNTAALEILAAARRQGLFTVLEQTIAPRAVEEQLLAQEQELFPGWEEPRKADGAAARTAKREAEEWALSDLIVCGSEFVREGIAKAGGPANRCIVVPYGVDSRFARVERPPSRGRLRVLTVGEVSLRKGAPYVAQMAAALHDRMEFRWVGAVHLSPEGRRKMEKDVTLTGAVPRSSIFSHYEWADVFLLPSVCEGSATVAYEALSTGLPVVTTPNAGSPVRDGQDGFIAPVRDAASMTELFLRLDADRALLSRMSEAAASRDLSLASYRSRLLKELTGASTPGPAAGVRESRIGSGDAVKSERRAHLKPWVVCQLGAREYYAVARAVAQMGRLAALVTDTWVERASLLRFFHSRLPNRYHPELASASIHSWNFKTIFREITEMVSFRHGWRRLMLRNAWFQQHALEALSGISFPADAPPVLFAYSYAARDLFRWARSQGWTTVLGQIDPGPPEVSGDGPPSWDRSPAPQEYWDLWREECALADAIVVNSQWSRQCMIKAGLPPQKLHLIPLAFSPAPSMESEPHDYPSVFTPARPLRVLYLGHLIPRKGIEEILESAALLCDEPVEFTFVGKWDSGSPSSRRRLPNVKVHHYVPRFMVGEFYREADVFLFPSHSDGFGLTQLEAQSCALPVIASRYCGNVVQHGVNGLLLDQVTAGDITKALRWCLSSPGRLRQMSEQSRVEGAFQFGALKSHLDGLLRQLDEARQVDASVHV